MDAFTTDQGRTSAATAVLAGCRERDWSPFRAAPSLAEFGLIEPARLTTSANAGEPAIAIDAPLGRAFDIAIAVAAILVFLPPLVVVALGIKLSTPGPVLFVQQRVGRDGALFAYAPFLPFSAHAAATERRLAWAASVHRLVWEHIRICVTSDQVRQDEGHAGDNSNRWVAHLPIETSRRSRSIVKPNGAPSSTAVQRSLPSPGWLQSSTVISRPSEATQRTF